MAAVCKHFPGEGMDERNSHFCTCINDLSVEEWMDSYGYVYKELYAMAGTYKEIIRTRFFRRSTDESIQYL